ncbi:MAG: collagen-binding domain-containing protein [Candidatus Auribacterota bacterium]|nr:collagen-binding domain-containing protein [Candidatus Auribacterota bacterium]
MKSLRWEFAVSGLILPLLTVFFLALPLQGGEISAKTMTEQMQAGEKGTGPGGSPPGPYGDHWVQLQENTTVDSYDSRVGPYDTSKGSEARVGANCDPADSTAGVTLDNNAIVKGDVSVATPEGDGDITIINNSQVTGSTSYDAPTWELLPLTMPTWYTEAEGGPNGQIVGDYGSKPGEYEITNNCLQAYNGATVSFSSGIYHFDTFELSNNVNFQIDPEIGADEIVEVYVTESIVFENNSELLPPIQFSGDTTKLRFYYEGTTKVDLSNNVEFYGFIYAPNAMIEVKNNDSIYGNLVGKEVKLWNNGGVHYDKALMDQDFGSIFTGGIPDNPHKREDWKEIISSD